MSHEIIGITVATVFGLLLLKLG